MLVDLWHELHFGGDSCVHAGQLSGQDAPPCLRTSWTPVPEPYIARSGIHIRKPLGHDAGRIIKSFPAPPLSNPSKSGIPSTGASGRMSPVPLTLPDCFCPPCAATHPLSTPSFGWRSPLPSVHLSSGTKGSCRDGPDTLPLWEGSHSFRGRIFEARNRVEIPGL